MQREGDTIEPASSVSTAEPETKVNVDDLVEKVYSKLDMEELVAKVQQRLRQSRAIEYERRGWVQWP